MAKKNCSCKNGRISVVDPNDFYGQDSSSNLSVPLEDLTISVELNTNVKKRTILTTTSTKQSITSSSNSQNINGVSVNFIDGTKINDTKYLTTQAMDFVTANSMEKNHPEALGITSIDIDFNSSYAPLITINFVDVRGSAIFQHDSDITDNKNKFSVFFQLPYPLYKLKIKGYYGQSVEYCLHMVKFTSRFNAETGNFEITASFVGYTYAMLSDILVGFMKAIPYTTIGFDYYDKLKQEDSSIITLDELKKKINDLNQNVNKLLADNPLMQQITLSDEKLNQLGDIKNTINSYILNVESIYNIKDSNSNYDFLFYPATATTANITKRTNLQNDYNIEILAKVKNYNENNDAFSLKLKYDNPDNYYNLSYSIDSNNNPINTSASFDRWYKNNQAIMDDMIKYIDTNNINGLTTTNLFNAVYFKPLFDEIEENISIINDNKTILENNLAKQLNEQVEKNSDFKFTVRNIIKILTTSIDVILYTIWRVSSEAKNSNDRTKELQKVFSSNNTSDNSDYKTKTEYFPWPEYRQEIKGTLTEQYLGKFGVLTNPSNVDEIRFMNNLLDAFLTESAVDKSNDILIEETKTNWVSVNPVDTRLFITNNTPYPYKRFEFITQEDLIKQILYRATTLLGYSNRDLTQPELIQFATNEANMILNDVDKRIVQSFYNEYKTNPQTIPLFNFDNKEFYTKTNDGYYEYKYIFGNKDKKLLLPIADNSNNNKLDVYEKLSSDEVTLSSKADLIFLTNYNNSSVVKENDNAKYIEFFESNVYESKTYGISPPVAVNDTTIDYSELQKKPSEFKSSSAKLNIFNGAYGVQEFTSMDWGSTYKINPSFLNLFYINTEKLSENNIPFNKYNGTALKRKYTSYNLETKMLRVDETYLIKGKYTSYNSETKEVIDNKDLIPYSITKINGNYYLVINSYISKYDFNINNNKVDSISIKDCCLMTDGITEAKNENQNYEIHQNHLNYGQNLNNIGNDSSKTTLSYPYINFYVHNTDVSSTLAGGIKNTHDLAPFSLFGSKLYYYQNSQEARAFLFLHSFPFLGLNSDSSSIWYEILHWKDKDINNSIFDVPEILNLFSHRAGFISVPKIWAAFIGGLLKRYHKEFELTFRDSNGNSLIPLTTSEHNTPAIDEFLITTDSDITASISFSSKVDGKYKSIDKVLLNLPEQAKQSFINQFKNFVDSDWDRFRRDLELIDTDVTNDWNAKTHSFINVSSVTSTDITNYFNKDIIKNYFVISPVYEESNNNNNNNFYNLNNNLFLEINDDSDISSSLIDLMQEEIILCNTTYKIFLDGNDADINNPKFSNILIKQEDLNLYIKQIFDKLKNNLENINNDRQQLEKEIFGTDNENTIKLMLYRTCKNIYDKWIADSDSTDGKNIMFQCGERNKVDKELYHKRTMNGTDNIGLIDSFRFVSKSFRDIGDELAINPIPLLDYLTLNSNSSSYDVITNILSSNNFDFVPLPNFIDYTDVKMLKSIFEPVDLTKNDIPNTCGPSFVCVYLGQKSKQLDFYESSYPNDGFDIRCKDNSIDNTNTQIPHDFTLTPQPYEDPLTVFSVNFGQQNQNIFKSVSLDQSEFSETAESLKIIDDIANKGAETNRTIAGQNIYNVYSVRSYKVEVEMLGDAMIQPMMYFQLNNIPMFHGAYMITRVKHSIKPNNMLTNFTGVRIRNVDTPIFTNGELFMQLFDSNKSSNKINTKNVKLTKAVDSTNWHTTNTNPPSQPCGEYNYGNAPVDSGNYQVTKQIRALISNLESTGNYNAYNNYITEKSIKSHTTGALADFNGKSLTDLTVQQVIDIQKNKYNLFAAGRYQIIPTTLLSLVKVKDLSIDTTNIFNADLQDKLGDYLITNGCNDYLNSDGDFISLTNAINNLAGIFAALPLYSDGQGNEGINSTNTKYGDTEINTYVSKICAMDVAKVLIITWKNKNKKDPKFNTDELNALQNQTNKGVDSKFSCNEYAPLTDFTSNTSNGVDTLLMGDSIINALYSNNKFNKKNNSVGIYYNCAGADLDDLINWLTNDTNTYPNIKQIIVSIGVNDGYPLGQEDKITNLNNLLKKKFTKLTSKFILLGTIGWGGVNEKTSTDTTNYFKQFTGWTLIKPINSQGSEISNDVTTWGNKSTDYTSVAHDASTPFYQSIIIFINTGSEGGNIVGQTI
jgi:hypothetical protein